MSVDLTTQIAGITFQNPIFTASGTFGAGWQFENFMNVARLGAITTKGCAIKPWPGNEAPRSCDIYGGIMNSVGLQNPGVEGFIQESGNYLSELSQKGTRIICQVAGHTEAEYVQAIEKYTELAPFASAFELNISCPNVSQGGMALGSNIKAAASVIQACRAVTNKPLFIKLAPTRVPEVAQAAEEAGANALVAINSIPGMAINIETRRSKLSRPTGGMSGPCLHPIAVRMVYEAANACSLPIIGCGGVRSETDVIEFMLAGATAVEVGSQNLFHPTSSEKILDGLIAWADAHGIHKISELVGAFEE